jgi:hypothetical protein
MRREPIKMPLREHQITLGGLLRVVDREVIRVQLHQPTGRSVTCGHSALLVSVAGWHVLT